MDSSVDATEWAITSVVIVGLNKWLIIGNGDEGLIYVTVMKTDPSL